MNRNELLERTIESIKKLPHDKLKEVSDFAAFVLSRVNDNLLSEEITELNAQSKSFQFLEEEDDLYTVNDAKVKYGK